MISRCIVAFLILILLGGCAQTTVTILDLGVEEGANEYEIGLELLEGDWNELVGMDKGLSAKGCRIFFAQDEVVCLQTWRRLKYDDKVSFFYEHVSVFKRGLWNYRRTQEHLNALNNGEGMTEDEFQVELNSFSSTTRALACVGGKIIHEDFCLLYYEPLATPTETEVATGHWLQEDYMHITAEAH